MSVVYHKGKTVPILKDFIDPQSKQWFWWVYDESEIMADSEFLLPSGMLLLDSRMGQSVQDRETGITYPNANGAFVSINGVPEDTYEITNRYTLQSDGKTDDKSLKFIVRGT